MQNKEHIKVEIMDLNSCVLGSIEVINKDPRFILYDMKNEIMRGYKIRLLNETTNRDVVGVTIEKLHGYLEIIAPKQFNPKTGKEKYVGMYKVNGNGNSELRPGTQILGGRNTGFYDDYGIIVQAEYTGGAIDNFEDWAFLVLAKSDFRRLATQWILLDSINGIVEGPKEITKFKTHENSDLDKLLENGEYDLFDYFIKHPDKLDNIHPKQFENLVSSIYKNLGFNVESVGAWNQADGGIDIIAVSKSFSGFEYRLAIQCKASKNKISARPIRELAGVLENKKIHQGVVATTSKFTANAIKEKEGFFWNIDLVDKERLLRRMALLLVDEEHKLKNPYI